jgi:hypothetical protein
MAAGLRPALNDARMRFTCSLGCYNNILHGGSLPAIKEKARIHTTDTDLNRQQDSKAAELTVGDRASLMLISRDKRWAMG